MFQAFVIVLREGFEAFLIVAIIASYLRKTWQHHLIPAVKWGIAASVVLSVLLGYLLLQGANQPLWEGVFGLIAAVLVSWLVVHMWLAAPRMRQKMENRLSRVTTRRSKTLAVAGVFLFTLLMITREGMETALLLIQIHDARIVSGILMGLTAAVALAYVWARWGHLINLKLFFQVTSIFLLLFVIQILVYSFHEFAEAGILPNSEVLHVATEPFSPAGFYGKWFSFLTVGICAGWVGIAWVVNRFSRSTPPLVSLEVETKS